MPNSKFTTSIHLPKIVGITALSLLATLLTFEPVLAIQTWQISSWQVAAETGNNRQDEADQLMKRGILAREAGKLQVAIAFWQQALAIYQEIGIEYKAALAMGNLGLAYDALADYPTAIKYLEQTLKIVQRLGNRQIELAALLSLSLPYSHLGNYQKAIEYQEQSLAIARELKDLAGEGEALANLGGSYFALGNYTKSSQYRQQYLEISRSLGDKLGEANALIGLGLIYDVWGNYQPAINNYQQALKIAQELGNRNIEKTALVNLGLTYSHISVYPQALKLYQQGLVIAKELGDRWAEGIILGNLGNIYEAMGDYFKALDYYQQSLAISQAIKSRPNELKDLWYLGNVHSSLGNYAQAIDNYQKSLAISKEIGEKAGEAKALSGLGLTYLDLGNFERSIDYQQKSLQIFQQIGDKLGESKSLTNLGNVYNTQKNYSEALEIYQKSLKIAQDIQDPNSEAIVLGNIGIVYQELGDYPQALDYQQRRLTIARKLGDRGGESIALNNLGNIYSDRKDYEQGIKYQRQSLNIVREINDRVGETKSLNNIGFGLLKLERFAEAETMLRAAMKVKESLRASLGKDDRNKVSLFETQSATYRLLQQTLIAQSQPEAALEIAERGRSRAFVELLAARLSDKTTPENYAPPTIAQIKQIAKAANATLVEYAIINDDFEEQGKWNSRESQLFIWVIQPTGKVDFRQVDLTPLWWEKNLSLPDLVANSREALGVRGRGGIAVEAIASAPNPAERLQQLHQLLIAPIAELLPKNPRDRVIFFPHKSLFLVPFPALPDATGKYLIEKHTIITAPSIQVLDFTRQQRQRIANSSSTSNLERAVIVGNPTMPSIPPQIGEPPEPLNSLPGAEEEAKAIAQLLKTAALIGKQANKSTVLQQMTKAKLIHFATHGLLDDFQGAGIPGAIALAPDPNFSATTIGEINGLLAANEILNLKLNAELVVLSACDTGRGTITGDGVIGLSRALISAGVPSVIVSLWAVPDAPTATLMTEFYRQLSQQSDKAQALRQAMLATMKQHPNPKDWAAFILIGEAD